MFSWIRRRFNYANVTATLALFFAMTGGALAASHYLITSTKQIKPSVLSALKGKAGPAGANGANGANGASGEKGASGPQGPAGTNGAAGESVVSAALKPKEGGCAEGGSKFTVGGKETTACNGKAGANGTTGFTATLPPEKTETGTWSLGQVKAEGQAVQVPISFDIPLKEGLATGKAHFVTTTEGSAECPGTDEKPVAAPGNLCVYEGTFENLEGEIEGKAATDPIYIFNPADIFVHENFGTAGTAGAVIVVSLKVREGEFASARGTWAVTAPMEP